MAGLVLIAGLLMFAGAAPDYDAAMAPYHTAFDAAEGEMASANRLNAAHDKAGTCMALTAAVTDFGNAASALAPVFTLLAGDSGLDEAKRAGLTAQAQQAKDTALLNVGNAQAEHDRLCG